MPARRRHNNQFYQVKVNTPTGDKYIKTYDNLDQMKTDINNKFFSRFEIITRSMLSNWIHYPDKSRRFWADAIEITKMKTSILALK
jgi:hypothetical protein